jgi:hypothetical protein
MYEGIYLFTQFLYEGIYLFTQSLYEGIYLFTQFIYEGVSYMNGKQEEDIRDHMASKAMFAGLERYIYMILIFLSLIR